MTYVIVRAIGLALQYHASSEIPGMRPALNLWLTISLGGLAAVLIGGLLGGAAQYWAWGLAIVVDLVAAGIGGREDGWNLKTGHFAERHGLFVIIALGETLIVAATAVTGADWTASLMTVGILAVVATCGLWWSYFRGASERLENAFEEAPDVERTQIGRDSYSLIHFVMLSGVIAYAAAIEEAVAHPSSALEQPGALALGIGIALFTGGMALSLRRATGTLPSPRLIIGLLTGAAVALLHVEVAFSLGIAIAGLVLIGIIERKG
jgi:low temperature requirement protein LtrA